MVKHSYLLWPYVIAFGFFLSIIGASLYMIFATTHQVAWNTFLQPFTEETNRPGIFIIGCSLVVSLILMSNLYNELSRNRLRQWAANHDKTRVRVATEQPEPDGVSLAFPVMLRRSLSWRSTLLIPTVTYAVLLGIEGIAVIAGFFNHAIGETMSFVYIWIAILFQLILFYGMYLILGILLRQKIVITEDGFTMSEMGQHHTVRWDEARLFSLPYIESSRTTRTIRSNSYEIASKDTIIRWSYLSPNFWFVAWNTNVSVEEYNRTLDALNGYVVARTGLALFDLRS